MTTETTAAAAPLDGSLKCDCWWHSFYWGYPATMRSPMGCSAVATAVREVDGKAVCEECRSCMRESAP